MSRPVPVDSQRSDWPRLVANAINEMQRPAKGAVRFFDGRLQHWDGMAWQDVP